MSALRYKKGPLNKKGEDFRLVWRFFEYNWRFERVPIGLKVWKISEIVEGLKRLKSLPKVKKTEGSYRLDGLTV